LAGAAYGTGGWFFATAMGFFLDRSTTAMIASNFEIINQF
jgi:hypothetical protein